MTPRFTQVTKGRWPSGIDKPIAVLRAEPDELAALYGLEFHAGSDELDRFQEAALRLGSGRSVLLYRYERSPGIGTTVPIDGGDRAFEAFDEIAVALGFASGSLSGFRTKPARPQHCSARSRRCVPPP